MKINIFNTFEQAKQAQEYDHLYQIEECEQNICKQDIIDAGLEPKHDIEFQIIEELQAENQALQTKIKTLEDLNAISYDANARLSKENQALLAKNGELLAENKIWQEMVDSTNQTNQALIKKLDDHECKIGAMILKSLKENEK